MGSMLQLDLKPCILGILPDADLDTFFATFLQEIFFSARKLIAKSWLHAHIPTLQEWIVEVNTTLRYKRLLYRHRRCPAKFETCTNL